MRTLFGFIIVAAVWFGPRAASACGCCDHHQDEHAHVKPSAAETRVGPGEARITIPIARMHCAHCASRVETALTNLKGVKLAEAKLHDEVAVVIFDKAALGPTQIVDAINGLGFKAGTPIQN